MQNLLLYFKELAAALPDLETMIVSVYPPTAQTIQGDITAVSYTFPSTTPQF